MIRKPCNVFSAVAIGLACAATAAPASATLMLAADVSGTSFTCFDNNIVCDVDPTIGVLSLGSVIVVNGVTISGSTHTSTQGALNILASSSINVTNNSGAPRDILVAIGDTNFIGPASSFIASGSGTFTTFGSSIDLLWFNDPANAQGAEAHLDLPGNLVHSFSHTVVDPGTLSYATNSGLAPLAVPDPGLFSMTLHFHISLLDSGSLISRGQVLFKPQGDQNIPEPTPLLLLGIGLAVLSFMRRKHTPK